MSWFFIALAAPFLWALVNIADQYLVAKYSEGERSSGALVLFSSLIGIVAAVVIGIFSPDVFGVAHIDKLLLLATGVLTIAWVILYLFTLEIEDVSAVVPWFLTVPIFGYVLGYIFLGETLTQTQQIGSLIVLAGAGILSVDFSDSTKRRIKWRAGLYMLAACLMIAIIGVIFKYVTIGGNFWASSFWEYVGLGTTGILLFVLAPRYRREFLKMIREGGKSIFSLNIGSELLTIAGNLLTNFALLLAPVAMVYLVGSFQPGIVLVLTLLATRFFPSIAIENTSKRVLVPKIIAIAIMIVGSAILFK